MAYDIAVAQAWQKLKRHSDKPSYGVRFLTQTYTVNLADQSVISACDSTPAKTPITILILHYLSQKLKGLPAPKGEWSSFKELEGGEIYYPTFRKRVLEVVLKKITANPGAIGDFKRRMKARDAAFADTSLIFDIFEDIPVLMNFWKGDEEFKPEANILFDVSISSTFCTEDVAVLAETLARAI